MLGTSQCALQKPSRSHDAACVQTWPSSVLQSWFRAIGHYADNNTTPLNVTLADTADIISTLRVLS